MASPSPMSSLDVTLESDTTLVKTEIDTSLDTTPKTIDLDDSEDEVFFGPVTLKEVMKKSTFDH